MYGAQRLVCVSQHHPNGVVGDITIGTAFNEECVGFEDGNYYWCFVEK